MSLKKKLVFIDYFKKWMMGSQKFKSCFFFPAMTCACSPSLIVFKLTDFESVEISFMSFAVKSSLLFVEATKIIKKRFMFITAAVRACSQRTTQGAGMPGGMGGF